MIVSPLQPCVSCEPLSVQNSTPRPVQHHVSAPQSAVRYGLRLRPEGRYGDHGSRERGGLSAAPSSPSTERHAELVALAGELRPELHRYCARLMGSVIDGEDVVQDTFARALVALDELQEAPSLRLAVPHRPQPRAGPAAQPRDPRGRAHRGGPRGRRSGEPRSRGGADAAGGVVVEGHHHASTTLVAFSRRPTLPSVWLFLQATDHQTRRKPSLPVKELWKLPSMSVV